MLIAKTIKTLNRATALFRTDDKRIGFVPTMGALHQGHLSLIERSMKDCDHTICSIFVNPTQFNNSDDLKTYPNTLESDIEKLQSGGCDVLFLPSVPIIYPNGAQVVDHFDFDGLDLAMEGKHRPGHFAGVAQVVKTLLELVAPHNLYLGQKDYQQFCILRRMVELLKLPIDVINCPIVREKDGLAMSSRNLRLGPDHRKAAPLIAGVLHGLRANAGAEPWLDMKAKAVAKINLNPFLECEYLELADARTLKLLDHWDQADELIVCTVVWAGDVRLIDNVLMD